MVFNPQLSLLHAEPTQLFQAFFICQVLQSSHQLDGLLLDYLQFFSMSFLLRGSRLDTIFQVWPSKCWGDWNYHVFFVCWLQIYWGSPQYHLLSFLQEHQAALCSSCHPFTLSSTIYFLTTYNESKEQKFTKLLEEKGFTLKPSDFSLHPQYGRLGFSSFLLLKSWTYVAHNPELCPREEAVTSHSIFWNSFKFICCHNDFFFLICFWCFLD